LLFCPRWKTAKIDRLWFATFVYFNKMPGVESVYLWLASQEATQEGGF